MGQSRSRAQILLRPSPATGTLLSAFVRLLASGAVRGPIDEDLPVAMPRPASIAVLLAPLFYLTACSGFGVFLDDTHSATSHVNRPIGNSETMRRAEGKPVDTEPLRTEAGNVWPGPVQPQPTLQDLARQPAQPLPNLEGSTPPSIANVPTLAIPAIPHHLQPRPGDVGTGVLNGPLPLGTTGAPQLPPPSKASGITVPNGDGTSTVIAPDGSISTIPTPK